MKATQKTTAKIALAMIAGALALQNGALAITVAPPPTFEEVVKTAKLIGVVKVVSVPEEPKGGFTDANPPTVGVIVTESLHGEKKDAELKIQWHSGDMLKLTSWNSAMLPDGPPRPEQFKITLPKVNDEYFVFLEKTPKDGLRDIYGWKRLAISPKPAEKPEKSYLWAWKGVLKPQPLTNVSRAREVRKAARHGLAYETKSSDNPCIREAFLNFEINASGPYWVLTDNGAVKHDFVLKGKKEDFVLRHTVAKGETLFRIAEEYYDSGEQWRRILEANRAILKDEKSLQPGMILVIPSDSSEK